MGSINVVTDNKASPTSKGKQENFSQISNFRPFKNKMVCISCIVIPVVLWLWHRFLQPMFLKFWNPWQPAVEKSSIQTGENDTTSNPGGNLKCPFSSKSGGEGEENNPHLANGSSVKNDITQNAISNGHVKAD